MAVPVPRGGFTTVGRVAEAPPPPLQIDATPTPQVASCEPTMRAAHADGVA